MASYIVNPVPPVVTDEMLLAGYNTSNNVFICTTILVVIVGVILYYVSESDKKWAKRGAIGLTIFFIMFIYLFYTYFTPTYGEYKQDYLKKHNLIEVKK